MKPIVVLLAALSCGAAVAESGIEPAQTERLYQTYCAVCHHPQRLGLMGPALIPEALARVKPEQAVEAILKGRPATQMPAFEDKLSPAQARALAEYIYTPLAQMPVWTQKEIRETHKVLVPAGDLPARPVHAGDPENLFVVVERGDHHATILDGDRFEPLHRFRTHGALQGTPGIRPTGASCSSPHATAGSASSTSGACRRLPRCAPASTPATWRFRATGATSWWPTTCRTRWCCSTPSTSAWSR